MAAWHSLGASNSCTQAAAWGDLRHALHNTQRCGSIALLQDWKRTASLVDEGSNAQRGERGTVNISDLKLFLVAAEERSFTQAAKRCFMAQQGFSASIRRLERAVGADLFERSPAGVELTPAGRSLLAHARMIVGMESEVLNTIHGVDRREQNCLVVGVVSSAGRGLLSLVLRKFQSYFPEIEISIRNIRFDEIERCLLSGELDVLYSFMPFKVPGWSPVPLYREPLSLLVHRTHRFAGTSVAGAELLMHETFIAGNSLPAGWTDVGWLAEMSLGTPRLGDAQRTDVRSPFEVNEVAAAGIAAIPVPRSHRAAFPHPMVGAVELRDEMTAEVIVAIPAQPSESHRAIAALSVELLR